MSWDNNAPIRFQFGTVALWNLFFRRGTIDGNNPALEIIKNSLIGRRQFDDLTRAPLPASMETRY